MMSLRRMLSMGLVAVIVLTTGVSAWFSYREGLREANELFDAKLAHSARVLQGLVDESLATSGTGDPPAPMVIEVWKPGPEDVENADEDLAFIQGHVYETQLAFQVWDSRGRLRLYSDEKLTAPLAPLAPGFSKQTHDERRWRVFALRSDSGLWYLVGEENRIRKGLAKQIAAGILVPPLLGLPLMVALVWLLLGWGMRDLKRVVRQINDRAAGRLDPIEVGRTPREVAVTVAAVNALLERLRSALECERRFTGDAAHELRTPITALRIHLDNLRHAEDETERAHAVASLQQALGRLSRLIEQLLLLSRLEPGAPPPPRRRLDLARCVDRVLEEPAIAELGGRASVDLRLPAAPFRVLGDVTSLELLIRNLIDNALRYSPPGGRVLVTLSPGDGRIAVLAVEDSGPGIPEEARQRVFERFHRELGSEQDGSGLGLSIVRRLVELLGARIELDDSPALGGLRVRVWLPAGDDFPRAVERLSEAA